MIIYVKLNKISFLLLTDTNCILLGIRSDDGKSFFEENIVKSMHYDVFLTDIRKYNYFSYCLACFMIWVKKKMDPLNFCIGVFLSV